MDLHSGWGNDTWYWSCSCAVSLCETLVGANKGFDIDACDVTTSRRSYSGRESFEQGILAAWASGKHTTNDILSKFNRNILTAKCPLCGERKNKYHPIFCCKGVEALWNQFSAASSFAKTKLACWNFGILPLDIQPLFDKSRCAINFPELVLPDPSGELAQVFTDGNCFLGTICLLSVEQPQFWSPTAKGTWNFSHGFQGRNLWCWTCIEESLESASVHWLLSSCHWPQQDPEINTLWDHPTRVWTRWSLGSYCLALTAAGWWGHYCY